ncbi:MAG: hypothetical protein N3E45_17140 [Oscillatoriaceae bacterium SKW80]|nr:hypothetical protein [Oscillatoriaceae bacterium SKW80]HIK27961.1 hypothetical protein [Oscillatoriaceae cyanobacterium M7585_C2015_266]
MLANQFALTQDSVFRNRVTIALFKVISEAAQEKSSGDYRRDLARKRLVDNFIGNNQGFRAVTIDNFLLFLVTDESIAELSNKENPNESIDDKDIEESVKSFFDIIAGININNPEV